MRRVLAIPVHEVTPSPGAVLESQGIPRATIPGERTARLAQEAVSLYERMAQPVGVLMETTADEFRAVFDGEGRNDPDSPVAPIYRAADHLALFAVTVGEVVCGEITRLFRNSHFALGSMLDAAASAGAELAAEAVEHLYQRQLREAGLLDADQGLLRFSPGYCGWHLGSQKALFSVLRPADIGIALNESCLMQPLKSISGAVVAGRKEIFDFEDVYSFCAQCATHECRDRITALMGR